MSEHELEETAGIEIRNPRPGELVRPHDIMITRGNVTNVVNMSDAELCQLYAMIELRLRGLGFSRVRMLKVAEIASRPGPAQQARR